MARAVPRQGEEPPQDESSCRSLAASLVNPRPAHHRARSRSRLPHQPRAKLVRAEPAAARSGRSTCVSTAASDSRELASHDGPEPAADTDTESPSAPTPTPTPTRPRLGNRLRLGRGRGRGRAVSDPGHRLPRHRPVPATVPVSVAVAVSVSDPGHRVRLGLGRAVSVSDPGHRARPRPRLGNRPRLGRPILIGSRPSDRLA